MIAKLKAWWHGHGTKILGGITALLGSVQAAITVGLMDVSKGWKNAVALTLIALGTATIRRGFTNSANATPATAPK